MSRPPYFLFDIGASQTRVGTSADGENIDNMQAYPTPSEFSEGVKELAAKVNAFGKFETLAGGVAGPMFSDKGSIINAPNLPDWNEKPLALELTRLTGAKVYLENDTALVGLGEAVKGAGMHFKIVAYVTVSTGVNGVLIIDKKIVPNVRGFEIGKQLVDFDATYDRDAKNFEDLVAGSQFKRRFGVYAHETDDPNIWAEEANLVSVGITNTILFWSPEIVVVGGSVANKIPLELLIENINKKMTIFSSLPLIKKAEIDTFAGLWGALHWVKSLDNS